MWANFWEIAINCKCIWKKKCKYYGSCLRSRWVTVVFKIFEIWFIQNFKIFRESLKFSTRAISSPPLVRINEPFGRAPIKTAVVTRRSPPGPSGDATPRNELRSCVRLSRFPRQFVLYRRAVCTCVRSVFVSAVRHAFRFLASGVLFVENIFPVFNASFLPTPPRDVKARFLASPPLVFFSVGRTPVVPSSPPPPLPENARCVQKTLEVQKQVNNTGFLDPTTVTFWKSQSRENRLATDDSDA